MSIFSAITLIDVEQHHNPNQGRVIINDNFRKIFTGVSDSIGVSNNFATADLTFTGNRAHNTSGFSYELTTDSGAYEQSWHYMDQNEHSLGYNATQISMSDNLLQLGAESTGGSNRVIEISNSGVAVGFNYNSTFSPSAKFDIKAHGLGGGDKVLRVLSFSGTQDLFKVAGNGDHTFGSQGSTSLSLNTPIGFSFTTLNLNGQGNTERAGFRQTSNRLSILHTNSDTVSTTINTTGIAIGFGDVGASAKLDIKAQGSLSSDLAFRVRNSIDTTNLFEVQGNGNAILSADFTASRVLIGDGILMSGGTDIMRYAGTAFIKHRFTNNGTTAYFEIDPANSIIHSDSSMSVSIGASTASAKLDVKASSFNSTDLAQRWVGSNGRVIGSINSRGDWTLGTSDEGGYSRSFTMNNDGNRGVSDVFFSIVGSGGQPVFRAWQTDGGGNGGCAQVGSNANNLLTRNANIGLGVNRFYGTHNWAFVRPSASQGWVRIGLESGALGALTVDAQGALSSDIAFNVRNSVNTIDMLSINGLGDFNIKNSPGNHLLNLSNDGKIHIGYNANLTNLQVNDVVIGYSANISSANGGQRVVIGNNASSSLYYNVAVGLGATTNSNAGVAIGYNATTSGGDIVNPQVAIGSGMATSAPYAVMIGNNYGTIITNDIANSFMLNLKSGAAGRRQHFFVNGNTNVLLASDVTVAAGTHYEVAATNTITIHNGVRPTSGITNAFQQYSDDIVDGNAAPHFRTEAGDIVKLYKYIDAALSNTANSGDANTDALIEALKALVIALGVGSPS